MLRYHVAFYLPRAGERMVVAEALDFPGAVTQGFDLADARLMISSAMEDLGQLLLEEGKPLPRPNPDASAPDADLIELLPLSIEVGTARPGSARARSRGCDCEDEMRRIPIIACLIANVCFAAHPVIFDTDMGNDIDDALALAVLHALSDRGECELIGVTLTNAHPAAVPYIQMLNRFYGRGDLPVGTAIKELQGGANDGYMAAALRAAPAASASPAEAAPALLRR